MTDSIWNDLCQQPVITASTEKYTTLVTNATTQLRQPIDSIMTTLNERAMALSKCANFEAALRDANTMQQLSPSSPIGYLCEATIFNEQGKWRQAIDTCNKGFNVVDTNDAHYAMLQRAKADAEDSASKRIDFIKELPVDIVTSTLIPMLVDDFCLESLTPCPYLHVSHVWRDSILQCSGELHFHTSYSEEEEDVEKCAQLVRFARHINSLHVRRYSKGTWLSDLLRHNEFSSLRGLSVNGIPISNMDDFVRALGCVGDTLTHLTIHEGDHGRLSFVDILTTCSNLNWLTISQHNGGDFSSLPTTTWPNITTLSIEVTEEYLTRDQIIRICKCFPSLKKFQLHPCQGVGSALLIPQYCPLLTSVELEIYMFLAGVTYMNEVTGSESLTMTKFSVTIEHLAGIGSILTQHHTSLEAIDWNIYHEEDHEELRHIQYPRLKRLSLHTSGSWMLHNAPILEELNMSSKAINADPAILDAIPPCLRKLEFKFGDGIEFDNQDGIVQYLHRVSQKCLLLEFAITFTDANSFRCVLDAIPCLSKLERLIISVRAKWDAYHMERFLDNLVNGCPHLSCLDIDCVNAPPTYSLDSLKRLDRLKQLAFSIEGTDGYDSFWQALRTFSQLKLIQVYHATPLYKSVIRHLKQHRRDLKVIFV
ncbi:hypothetical protein O0I10_006289 [Lichtheimia ornata]|uniref:F-box domain-containing protein n=1 Tax=Lichtheimia ornata TaxID=688661 RepID=A0AAD7V3M8_9FUNG|nr:uncharacterized protein O0I10_006289 [Lichtheimia ornata]KAJ8658018.1 hypothetical protein O0I10_006289 [Lichtheimia ornata]